MTKGKLDKVINGGMKAKLILIGVCVILLVVMILTLCLAGGSEETPEAEGSVVFASEDSEAGTEPAAVSVVETSEKGSAEPGNVGTVQQGTVNQQESGEAAQPSEIPAQEQPQTEIETEAPTAGEEPAVQSTTPDTAPGTQPTPGTSAEPQISPQPDMTLVVEQQDDEMVVTTGYCVVEYPFAFSEIIQVALQESDTGAALEFIASIRGQTAPLYTLWFDTDQGVPYGTVTAGGASFTVNVETYEPTGLTEENKVTFTAAQETINDVLQSLQEKNTFQAVE